MDAILGLPILALALFTFGAAAVAWGVDSREPVADDPVR